MKIKIIISLISISSIVFYLFVSQDYNTASTVEKMTTAPKQKNTKITVKNTQETIPKIKNTQAKITTVKNKATLPLYQNKQYLWGRPDGQTPKKFPYNNPDKLKYEYVEINQAAIAELEIDDEFPIFIPQSGHSFMVQIKTIMENSETSKSYRGYLNDHDQAYQIFITQGPNTIFANVTTPEGKFVLEADGDDAWIYDYAEITSKLDYSKSDAIKIKNNNTH